MILVSNPRGGKECIKTTKMMLARDVTCQSNMVSKMATAETSKWSYVCNYELKFDDASVYPYVFVGKECIKTITNYVGPLLNMSIQYSVGQLW